MKKTILSFACIVLAASLATAQSVDDGIKALYYGKNTTAKNDFQAVVSKNPKDGRAVYWLGQAYLADRDEAGARTAYQTAMTAGVSDPYLLVGMGQLDLIAGNNAAARQKFEQAITASKNKKGQDNADILDAIGRANAYGGNKIGDPAYSIDILKRAAQLDPKNVDIDINLGINYLKLGPDHGGDAVTAFNDAIARDPKNAAALSRIGNIYKSQDNKESMEEYYNKAVTADPTYAPVYYNWFDYYQNRDINAAQDYLTNYVKYADQDCNTDYFKANYLFRAGKYDESKAAADAMAAGNCRNYPRLNILYAYNYDRLGDSTNARTYLEKYFATQTPSPDDAPLYYQLAGKVYSKFPGYEDTAVSYLSKAMDADTVARNKRKYIDSIASIYKRANKPVERFTYIRRAYNPVTDTSSRALYTLTDAAIAAKDPYADSAIMMYKAKFPDQLYPYKLALDYAATRDTTGAAAVSPRMDYIGFLAKDTTKNAQVIAYNYALLGSYYNNYAKNSDSALYAFQQAAKYDPSNTQYQDIVKQLQRPKRTAAPPATRPAATKPAAKKPGTK